MKKVSFKDLLKFSEEVLIHNGVRKDVAEAVSLGLCETSLRGVDSHGISLFPHYVRAMKAGRINSNPDYKFEATSVSTGRLNADHTFGHAVGIVAMNKAIEIAKETGISAVGVYNSSHFGAAACYGLLAPKQNMIGICSTHADSLMLTPNSTESILGTNPLCFTAPIEGEEPFCLDMATTIITWNKVKIYRGRKEDLPDCYGADSNGELTKNPFDMSSLLPMADYKGFGLAMMIDILCGLLTGMPVGDEISSMYKSPLGQHRKLGQFYIAINIEKFEKIDVFKKRLKKLVERVRKANPKNKNSKVMVPGDPEKKERLIREKEGIPIEDHTMKDLESISEGTKIRLG